MSLCPVCKKRWIDYYLMERTKDGINVCNIDCKRIYDNWLDNSKKVKCIQNHLADQSLTIGKIYNVVRVGKDKHGEVVYNLKNDMDFLNSYTHCWFEEV